MPISGEYLAKYPHLQIACMYCHYMELKLCREILRLIGCIIIVQTRLSDSSFKCAVIINILVCKLEKCLVLKYKDQSYIGVGYLSLLDLKDTSFHHEANTTLQLCVEKH